MAKSQLTGNQIKDGAITRDDINVTTVGKAVVTKIIDGSNGVKIDTTTGVDTGTGDVSMKIDLAYLDTKYPSLSTSKTQNLVFASPSVGSGVATFRTLVAGDIPALSYITLSTNQTGIAGNKATSGDWTFSNAVEVQKGITKSTVNNYGAINTRIQPTEYSFWGIPTGAIVIILPAELTFQDNFDIEIVNTQWANLHQKLQINTYGSLSYSKVSLVNDTGAPDVVTKLRIGKLADNRSCIIINDIDTAWDYPQMIVNKYIGGSSIIAKGNWTTQLMTDLSSITIQQEVSIIKAVNIATLSAWVTQTNLNSQLSNYAALNAVQTFTNTNTFSQSPIIPAGTLSSHAVNKNQLDGHTHPFASLTSKPTTILGYGITDAVATSQLNNYIPLTQKAAVNGVATLDSNGLIPTGQLPSYVDDVIEGANLAALNALPAGAKQTGKIYVALDTNLSYRWSGSVFVEISSGAVQSVNGQTGVVNLTKANVGLSNADNTADALKNVAYAASSSRLYSSDAAYNYNGVAPYYGHLSFKATVGRWRFEMSPNTPASIEVAYADNSGDSDFLGGVPASGYSISTHNHAGVYEPVFSKNTAFNKNFGSTGGTVAEGNDSRINHGETAYGYGNHADAGYIKSADFIHDDSVSNIDLADFDYPKFFNITIKGYNDLMIVGFEPGMKVIVHNSDPSYSCGIAFNNSSTNTTSGPNTRIEFYINSDSLITKATTNCELV